MEEGGASSKKRKSAALESTTEAPALVAIEEPDCQGQGDGGVGGGADRLSGLPDDVLGEIISLLATKEGARTRILASRWRDLWLSAPLNLDCQELIAIDGESVHAAVISGIISSHRGPGRRLNLNAFMLNIPAHTAEAWLRSAALDNLEELDFTCQQIEQPQRALIFRFSRTLHVANIGRCDFSELTFQGLHFPLLKQLGLFEVTISEYSLHTLIAGCSALECLLIYECAGFRCLRINSPTIRSLSVLSCEDGHHGDLTVLKQLVIENAPCLLRLLLLDPEDNLHVSVVAAPKLETLGFISDDTVNDDEFSKLVFGSTVIQGLSVDKLITVVRSVKVLALDMQDLSLDTVIELMRCFPCLEKLYIESFESRSDNLWRRKHRNLIRCFDMRLKTIVLANYLGIKSQVNFVTFFVLNANLLKSVTLGIKVSNHNEKFLAKQHVKLWIENRVSRDARFHFSVRTPIRSFDVVTDVRDYDLADPFAQ